MKLNKTGSMDIKKLIGEATEYDKKEMLESKRPKSWLKSVSAFANGKAEAANYPFCTIDPNVGVVAVPDERLTNV